MDNKFKLIIGLFVIIMLVMGVFLLSSDEPVKKKVVRHDIDDDPIENVIEETVVIKTVYINEEDFGSYSDKETGASYWYIYYDFRSGENKHTGYTMVEIDVPYFDLIKIRGKIKDYKLKDDDYLGITFFHRISFESYKANSR